MASSITGNLGRYSLTSDKETHVSLHHKASDDENMRTVLQRVREKEASLS